MNNRYNFSYFEWKQLCALRFRIDFGTPNQTILDHLKFNFNLEAPSMNKTLIPVEKYEEVIEEVLELYENLNLEYHECIEKFLEICEKQDLFFANVFPALLQEDNDKKKQNPFKIPSKCNIGISNGKLIILDSNFKSIKVFGYNQIMKWGYSAKLVILIVSLQQDNEKPIKLSFKTRMASNIVYHLNSYINIKMGKEPEPNSLFVNENVTREIYENKFYKKVNTFRKHQIFFNELEEIEDSNNIEEQEFIPKD